MSSGTILMAAAAVCACRVFFPSSCLPGSVGCPFWPTRARPDPVWMPGFYDDVDHDAERLVAEGAVQSAA